MRGGKKTKKKNKEQEGIQKIGGSRNEVEKGKSNTAGKLGAMTNETERCCVRTKMRDESNYSEKNIQCEWEKRKHEQKKESRKGKEGSVERGWDGGAGVF